MIVNITVLLFVKKPYEFYFSDHVKNIYSHLLSLGN